MNTRSMRTGMLIALLVLTVASVAFAGPVNCAVTPSNPACAPVAVLSYQDSGGGPIHFVPMGTPVYSSGSWLTTFIPQTFPSLFTKGQLNSAPDPFVGFSLGVINNTGSNMTFNFDFTTPFAGGPYLLAQTIFVDVLVHTAFSGTSSVTPTPGKFIMESYVNGVLIPGFGRGTGCSAGSPLFFCQSGAIGAIGPVPYLSAASGTLEVKGSYILTPHSFYTLTGRTELLQAVPEPGTLALVGTAVVGLASLLRRRAR
jgi:hypothetical protein